MRLSRTGFCRTSMTTLSALASTMGYQAPRRSTSATLSRHRAHPMGRPMKPPNVAHHVTLRYAHDRKDFQTANPARLTQERRETHAPVRPRAFTLGSETQRDARGRVGRDRGRRVV